MLELTRPPGDALGMEGALVTRENTPDVVAYLLEQGHTVEGSIPEAPGVDPVALVVNGKTVNEGDYLFRRLSDGRTGVLAAGTPNHPGTPAEDEAEPEVAGRRIVTVSLAAGDLDLVRHIDSATVLRDADGAGYDPEQGTPHPLTVAEAKARMDDRGRVRRVMDVPQADFARSADEPVTVYEVLHEYAFGELGVPEDATFEVLGVAGVGALVVAYESNLRPWIEEIEEAADADDD